MASLSDEERARRRHGLGGWALGAGPEAMMLRGIAGRVDDDKCRGGHPARRARCLLEGLKCEELWLVHWE